MATWDDVLTQRDRLVFKTGGFAEARIGFGKKAALLIVDVNYNFVGLKREPILESMKHSPLSCGEEGWAAVDLMVPLLAMARKKRVPVIYSTVDMKMPTPPGWRNMKASRRGEILSTPETNNIVREIGPIQGDTVIYKLRPSVFFGTPLVSLLAAMEIDTLIFCGTTTSGCVRASVVDAYSYGYRVVVVEECTFDRGEASHKVGLFDMNAKYADVIHHAEVMQYLAALGS